MKSTGHMNISGRKNGIAGFVKDVKDDVRLRRRYEVSTKNTLPNDNRITVEEFVRMGEGK
ncbi:MAG: hypothetical protein EHM58_04890 [Ignavibacteriae bacterium]|nr:MAG: hypothetical protein EHM58_04890 [Ignavibacteriota bacterium]